MAKKKTKKTAKRRPKRTKKQLTKNGSVRVRILDSLVPPLAGFADTCAFLSRGPNYELIFAYTPAKTEIVRILVGSGPLVNNMWPISREFYESTKEWMENAGLQPDAVGGETIDVNPTSKVFEANLFRMFRSGTSAILECFYVSPHSAHLFATLESVKAVEPLPIVSVQMHIGLMIGMLRAVKGVVDSVQTKTNHKKLGR